MYNRGKGDEGEKGEKGDIGPEGPKGKDGEEFWTKNEDSVVLIEGKIGIGTENPQTELEVKWEYSLK